MTKASNQALKSTLPGALRRDNMTADHPPLILNYDVAGRLRPTRASTPASLREALRAGRQRDLAPSR